MRITHSEILNSITKIEESIVDLKSMVQKISRQLDKTQ